MESYEAIESSNPAIERECTGDHVANTKEKV